VQEHECVWDFRFGHISIDGRSGVTTTQRGNIKCRRVFVQECQEIPPRTQMNARRTLLSTRNVHRDVMVESQELKPGVYIGRTLFPTEHRDLKVCMANTTNKTQLIAPGTCLGHAVSAVVVSDETPVLADSDGTPAVADDLWNQCSKSCRETLLPISGNELLIFSVNMMIFSPEVFLIWVGRIWSSTQLTREVIDRFERVCVVIREHT